MPIEPLLYASGAFTVVLGGLHFFFPLIVDFRTATLDGTSELRPIAVPFTRVRPSRSDVYGLVWVMNHAVSYALVSIGVLDLCHPLWRQTDVGVLLAGWTAGWWFLRAATQFHLGRRFFDWGCAIGFALLGGVHVVAAFQ